MSKTFWAKILIEEGFGSRKIFGLKIFGSKKILGPQNLRSTKVWVQKNIGIKKCLKVHKSYGQTKFWSKKCLIKKIQGLPKLGPNSLVKIWSVIARIFLNRTNVSGTYVAWTNVTLTFLGHMLPGQMSHWHLLCVKDGPRNLPLKFGQNRVSNSWDITDMDKCCKDICCMDKCHLDGWYLLKMVPGTYI